MTNLAIDTNQNSKEVAAVGLNVDALIGTIPDSTNETTTGSSPLIRSQSVPAPIPSSTSDSALVQAQVILKPSIGSMVFSSPSNVTSQVNVSVDSTIGTIPGSTTDSPASVRPQPYPPILGSTSNQVQAGTRPAHGAISGPPQFNFNNIQNTATHSNTSNLPDTFTSSQATGSSSASSQATVPPVNTSTGLQGRIQSFREFLAIPVSSPPSTPAIRLRPDSLRDSSALNRCDLEEVANHAHLITDWQTELLRRVTRKAELYPERFYNNYVQKSQLLILSDCPSIDRYSFCCIRNRTNPSGQCRIHKHCPYCSYLRSQKAMLTYVPSFHRGTWHHLTLSFHGSLPFDSTVQAYDVQEHWKAGVQAIKALVEQKLVRGIMCVEELKVLNFLPLQVMPHIHVLVEAEELGDLALESITESLSAHRNEQGEPLALTPSINIKAIESERSMYFRVKYLFKPMDLVEAYQSAWLRVGDNKWQAIPLNSQVRELLSGHFEITKRRAQLHKKGNLHASHPEYLGIPERERANYRQHLNDLRDQES